MQNWLSSEGQWYNFQVQNLTFPASLANSRPAEKVDIAVYVDENGNATDYKIFQGINPKLNAEAIRVLKLYNPEFIPAVSNGNKVKSVYHIKVSFNLQQG